MSVRFRVYCILLVIAFLSVSCVPAKTAVPLASPSPVSSAAPVASETPIARVVPKQNDLLFIEFFAIT